MRLARAQSFRGDQLRALHATIIPYARFNQEETIMGPFPHDAPKATISDENPAGTDGFEFVEFAHPEPQELRDAFFRMGYTHTANHKTKAIELWQQGDITYVLNNEPNSHNPDNIPCGGDAIIRMVDITGLVTMEMYSPTTMKLWYDGMGSKPFAQYKYQLVNLDGFECMEIPGFPEEDMRYEFVRIYGDVNFDNMTKEQEDKYKEFCFSEGCLHFAIRDVQSKISNKYGIRTNVSVDKIS